MSKFEDVNTRLEDFYHKSKAYEYLSPSVINACGNVAAEKVASAVRSIILSNYSSSGIKSKTGKLRSALGAIKVTFNRGGLVISMPKGLQEYKGGSNPYAVWASLNYGSVRTKKAERDIVDLPTAGAITGRSRRSVIGAAAKRTIKKQAFGGGASDRALNAVERGRKIANGSAAGRSIVDPYHVGYWNLTKSGTMKFSGGAIVTPPMNFWTLSESQRSELRLVFIKAMLAELAKVTGAAAA